MNHVKIFIKITLGSLILISSIDLSAQSILKGAGNAHIYQDNIYDYKDMSDIFIQNNEANDYYLTALKNRKAAKGWAYASLTGAGVGVLGFGLLLGGNIFSDDNYFEAGLFGAGISIAGISGIISLVSRSAYKRNQRRSVDAFNKAFPLQSDNEVEVELNLVYTSTGIGIQYKF